MTNFNQPRFYETQQEKLPSYLATKVDTLVMPSFTHAAQVLQQRQIRVINFSPESAVPDTIFEKVAFNEYFKSELLDCLSFVFIFQRDFLHVHPDQ